MAAIPEELQRLIDACDDVESVELRTCFNSRVRTMKSYSDAPTVENKKAMDAAREAYDEAFGRLSQKYFGVGQALKNRTRAVEWLQGQGWKVNKSKVYGDVKKGLLRMQSDGSIMLRDLEEYARRAELERPVVLGGDERSRARADEMEEAKLATAKFNARLTEIRLGREEGNIIDKGELVLALSAMIGMIDDALFSRIQARVGDVIESCGGDQGRSREVVALLAEVKDDAMREAAASPVVEAVFSLREEDDGTNETDEADEDGRECRP